MTASRRALVIAEPGEIAVVERGGLQASGREQAELVVGVVLDDVEVRGDAARDQLPSIDQHAR